MNTTTDFYKSAFRGFFFIAMLLGFFGGSLSADPLSEAQARMKERLPETDQLKREQMVGENNRGLLEAREPLNQEQEKLVKEENDDRKVVYEHVARQNGIPVEEVGRIRARQIAERSAKGVLIQNEAGQWEEKR